MLAIRSIPALLGLVGIEASLEELVSTVRAHMRLPLAEDQYAPYRGIAVYGPPRAEFAEIYNVNTTESFIIAQGNGAYWTPIDYPNDIYLFSCEKGVVGLVLPDRAAIIFRDFGAGRPPPTETLEQLHLRYKFWSIGEDYNQEAAMQEAAEDFVSWACGVEGQCVAAQL